VTRSTIVVPVDKVVAKLSGEVGDYWTRVPAEATALDIKDVVRVKNMRITDRGARIED
jgi:hypothetical protein